MRLNFLALEISVYPKDILNGAIYSSFILNQQESTNRSLVPKGVGKPNEFLLGFVVVCIASTPALLLKDIL